MALPFVLVVGHGPHLENEEGAASVLRQLGARVRTLDLWEDPSRIFAGRGLGREGGAEAEPGAPSRGDGEPARAIVIEGGERPDLAIAALRAVRREPRLEEVPAILAIPARQVTGVDPSSGFDDFIVLPYVPAELYARIRALEWKRSEFLTEERLKMGGLVIDRAAHEVTVDGRRVPLTAKEFALLAFLASNRGRVFSRETLLARVWGMAYDGGARTVDIHVRRLRAKLGHALPLETLRGAGYKLRTPSDPGACDLGDEEPRPVAKIAPAARPARAR